MRDASTRRQFLTGTAALIAGSMAGCVSAKDARLDLSVIQHDSLPTRASNWSLEFEMSLSGHRLYTREGAEAHTVDIARLNSTGEWVLDVVDLLRYGDDGGEPESWVYADDLAEGGTVVLLAAHNERGTVVSPDCENNSELNSLLPD